MCATCGCSGTIGTETTEGTGFEDPDGERGHVHLHASGHDHTHAHGDHVHGHDHDATHAHDHLHGYHHSHDHGHGHLHAAHGHDHAHEHPHVHGHADDAMHAHDNLHDYHHAHDHGHGHAHDHPDARARTDADPVTARTLQLEQEILGKNRLLAERNRGWLQGREIFAVNLMSSPGSGKTTLLERSIRDLGKEMAVSVIEGDQETRLDAERIRGAGARVVQINTGTGCHLDARMLENALRELSPPIGSLLFVENVGNLVCPALFDLGEAARVVIASTTEGEDKPLKYSHMFRAAHLVLLNKVDLLPHLTFDVERFLAHLRQVNPGARVFPVSATQGDGLLDWYRWIAARGSRVDAAI
ncbi:MAG TPA: hydrogenase nickel incorporation protein HypB [Myxococcaceae bacterium]|nr:hydrogenase nickel incorporation protein HypB [Myxococcaceae bacterium]